MKDQRKISICIPTFNRVDMTIGCFIDVLGDERVSEIVIVDDCSDLKYYTELKNICDNLGKIKLYRNLQNRDCYVNKMTALSFATNDWCCLWDSDNVFTKDYIDILFRLEWNKNTIYTPSFAQPHFNFRDYEGLVFSKENIAQYINKPMFEVCLNAANYFVNRFEYLSVWDADTDPVTSDSIYQMYNWLKNGGMLYIVPNLTYHHRVHDGSHYRNNVSRTQSGFHNSILNKLRSMV